MTLQGQQRGPGDILLVSIWVFGYAALIRFFAALQRVERLISGSKQVNSKYAQRA
jgi:hypothetical protein